MRLGLLVGLLLAAALVPGVAAAEDAPFARRWFVQGFAGGGGNPSLPADDRTANWVISGEVGARPFGGAFGTGFSITQTTDGDSLWSATSLGFFGQMDVTYILLTGIWAYQPPSNPLLRLILGTRLGLDATQSFRPRTGLSSDVYDPGYTLLRPALMSYLDLQFPLPWLPERRYAVVLRLAADTSINFSDLFRYSFSLGLSTEWGG